MAIDFDQIKNSHALSDVVGRYVQWDKRKTNAKRGEYWACCPFHAERTPSFHVTDDKQAFKCFGCGVAGDVFDFLRMQEGKRPREVAAMLGGAAWEPTKRAVEKVAKPQETYVVMRPGSERIEASQKIEIWNPKRAQANVVMPSMVFPYSDKDGLIGYVIRIDTHDGGKITPQVMWVAKDDGELCWAYAPFRNPKPMYGLDTLAPDGIVWMAEGEKAVDALRRMIGGNVLGWPGGVDGIKHVDWSPLDGREVVMWRDNDRQGDKCANDIRGLIKAASYRVVGGETDQISGWDAADAEISGWDADRVREWAGKWLDVPPEPEVDFDEGEVPDIGQFDLPDDHEPSKVPFRYLGYNRDQFYYLPEGKGQIVALKAGEHRELRLLELADMNYWRTSLRLPNDAKIAKEEWLMLADGLMRNSEHTGIFDETKVRGRGAWVDGTNVVVHTGSEVIIDRKATPLRAVKSRYVYEAAPQWEFGFGKAAGSQEAHKLVQICERLTWAEKMSGALLAGWCVIAPVSGALKWRSHIWITGSASSGKSTVLNDIVGRIVGPAAERFDGKTTEAAVRQNMGYDARPVIMDEAEGEDEAGIIRMQGLLDLARVSSSGGVMSKGGANHRPVKFYIRSSFCFSAINTSVRHYADESRISKLVLVPNKSSSRDEHYADLKRDIDATFTLEFASRMFARTIDNLPTLLKNIDVFTSAAAVEFQSRRAADQLGPMLAGYYLCHSTAKISHEQAVEFIRRHDWTDYLALGSETDESRLFQFLMSRQIRVTTATGAADVTIGVALEQAKSDAGDRKTPYAAALAARGIKYEDGMIGISDSAENTRALFREKPEWSADWKRPLRNLPGAMKSTKAERFGPGMVTKVTWLPYGLLDGTYVAREPGEDEE